MNCCKKCTIKESGMLFKDYNYISSRKVILGTKKSMAPFSRARLICVHSLKIHSNFVVINISTSNRMNIQILGAMLKQGCVQHNFEYVVKIMNIVKTECIKPNENFLKHLQSFHENCLQFKKTDVCLNIIY